MQQWEVIHSVPHLWNDTCHVYLAKTTDFQPWHFQLLSNAELEYALSFRKEQDRIQFIIGCALSRLVLAEQLNMPPHQVPIDRTCPKCQKPHGRPRLPDDKLHWSVSHSGEIILVAFTVNALVGVDVEWIRPFISYDTTHIIEGILTEKEAVHLSNLPKKERLKGILSYWTRKEAVLKATGEGLNTSPQKVEVSGPYQKPVLKKFEGHQDLLSQCVLMDFFLHPEYQASLAIFSHLPINLLLYDAGMLMKMDLEIHDHHR